MAKFDNVKENNRVWSVQHGWGTVTDFSEGYVHWFFQVKFDNGYDQWYFPDGRAEKKMLTLHYFGTRLNYLLKKRTKNLLTWWSF